MSANPNSYLVVVENQKKFQLYADVLGEEEHIALENTHGHIVKLVDTNTSQGWRYADKSKGTLERIKHKSKDYTHVLLAMDDGTEGERLAWDVIEFLEHPRAFRITPKELTHEFIIDAIYNGTRKIDQNLIDSNSARRSIEAMVGKNISQMMRWWFHKEGLITDEETLKKVGIGRVSASALALIVQAEEKIDTFIPELYKRVAVDYFHNNTQFFVKNKLKFTKDKKEELMAFMAMVKKEPHVISKFEKDTKDKVPPPPLNAAWLQRAASYQFQYTAKETMQIAKELYEGVLINGKRVSLITMPKTNSLFLSDETIFQIIQLLLEMYGEDYTFTTKRAYKGADKNTSQEAIRPVSFEKEFRPEHIKEFLTEEQHRLYEYIFLRTIATQMKSSIYDQSELVITVGGSQFKTTAHKRLFDGWEIIGQYWKDDEDEEREEVILPDVLIPSEVLKPLDIRAYEIRERSPWRYGEGRFVTTLEKYNIADASFISEIINFLEEKGIIRVINQMIYPTEFGKRIYYFLEEFAPWLIDLDYVAKFQEDILLIQSGAKNKNELIQEYENLKNETIVKLQYKEQNDPKIDGWLLDKARRISAQKKVSLPAGIESNKEQLMAFINEHKINSDILGKCPCCKEGDVYRMEHGYKCNVSTCTFVLWNNNIERFFKNFSKNISEEILPKYIEIMLTKGKCFIDNLYSPKKEDFFNAYISLQFNEKYQNWGLGFAQIMDKQGEEIPEQEKECTPLLTDGEKEFSEELDVREENKILKKKLEHSENERRLIVDASKKDPLTRAYNRRCFDADIEAFFKSSLREQISLAFVDGDKFKSINDTYGHQAGDKVLQVLSNVMFEGVRELKRARVYRYGGEEFLIVFVGEEKKDVLDHLNKIRKTIENTPIVHEVHTIHITISIGVSFVGNNEEIKDFIERADKAVYRAKENGRNRIEIGE